MSRRASTGLVALAGVLAVTCVASTTPPAVVEAQPATSTVPDHVVPPGGSPAAPHKRPDVQVVRPDHVVPFKTVATVTDNRIPAVLLAAYQHAAGRVPSCHLRWQVLAGIGKVESNHARGGQVDDRGTVTEPIFGPELSDGDHAVGPMQFLPSTWAKWGVDENHDGAADPQNVWDATASAADYLCADGRDLSLNGDLVNAVLSYNHDGAYLAEVFQWITTYSGGVTSIPAVPATAATATPPPTTTTSAPPPGTPTTSTPPPTTTTTTPPNVLDAVVGGLLGDVGTLLGKK
ncbi:lytic transglycosylase domain-containing protein [Kutzneria kofuensis]|uniref:Membrane-bound lytic murein transglycosylase B n=1 Tax=Kutzneria kofuensis TaxID=103725 RepID=A0A7W9KK18_9PSEU|nr:lytic murein transglycosylase [Kutzneria kofuensis]MBB5893733.1 membrane-bound lytic murein transglycosylase B [Kutzneria kofuensis]